MTRTEIVAHVSGRWGNYSVRVEGLDSLMRFLKNHDPEMRKAIQDGMKQAAQPVLRRANANAMRIADDGTYAKSLSIRSRANGGLLLRSNDVAAGVKEFALPGATYTPKPGDKRPWVKNKSKVRVGVPHRANAPRVMLPAVNDSVEETKRRIDEQLERLLQRSV